MCGIAGFIDFNSRSDEAVLLKMTTALRHRGPDGSGIHLQRTDAGTVGFGHRRLSIIDLSECGKQPMRYKQFVLVFNGEIYNYAEIKETLQKKGHRFVSHSDTEVILHAYEEWGDDAVHRFIGMFAFAIHDEAKNEVVLFRDRAGVKPLYYSWQNNLFLFGSELKALVQHTAFDSEVNPEAVQLFLQYGYIAAPRTIYRNCYKLLPGNVLRLSLANKQYRQIEYWNVADYYAKPVLSIAEEEALEETERLLLSACQYRMVADVPVGVFLSGGYDSSLVTALLQRNNAQKIKTFTIGFHEAAFNEAAYAKQVANHLGTDHHEYFCTAAEAKSIIPELPYFFDEPFGDSSAIPTILVSRFARQQVTVALSADGGDELFAGYNRYDQLVRLRRLKATIPGAVGNLASFVLHKAFDNRSQSAKSARWQKLAEVMEARTLAELNDNLSRHFTAYQTRKLLNSHYDGQLSLSNDLLNSNTTDFMRSLLLTDYKTYMVDDILTKVDRASMSVSLEGREPLLDHRVAEFVAQLPSHLKYAPGRKKYLLKKITWKYLPKEVMERPKAGFGVPVNNWLKTDLRGLVMDVLSEKELSRHGLLDTAQVCRLRDAHLQGRKNDHQLWLLLMFQLWWNQWKGQ